MARHDDGATQVEDGVAFPLEDGRRSTTATGRAVFADAARSVDVDLAQVIEAETDWRRNYLAHARALLEASIRTEHDAKTVPSAGLESLHGHFVFNRGGESLPLTEALGTYTDARFSTVKVTGEGSPEEGLSVPYRGARLRGDALHRRLDRWTDDGVVEPSFAEAIRLVMANPEWLDVSDQQVVILGAGAQMGPLHSLSRWGAHVLPVDLDRPDVWSRILTTVRRGTGHASIPVNRPLPADAGDEEITAAAGADLVTDMPEIATWLGEVEGDVTVGNYVYADGATHVRVSMAVDAVIVDLLRRRPRTAVAVLATPTDVFAVPEDCVEDSRRRFAGGRTPGVVRGAARAASRGRLFAPNYGDTITTAEGRRLGVADCLVPQQGPNYALAKRLQRWRASAARHDGVVTSVNVAPPTRTRSVLKNRVLAAAYAGAGRFGVEVFDPSTSNTLMAAMLVHDLRNPESVANPATPVDHPFALFWCGANHGGLWRNPHAARSVLGLAVVLGMLPRGA